MPPKKPGAYKLLNNSSNKPIKKATASSKHAPVNESQRNALTNMFKKIEDKDSSLRECQFCHEKIKSCLLSDHVNTKCLKRIVVSPNSDDIVFLHSNRQANLSVIQKKVSTPNSVNSKQIFTNEVEEDVVHLIKEEFDIKNEVNETKLSVSILNDESINLENNEAVTVKAEQKTRIEYNYKAEDEFKLIEKSEIFTQFNSAKSESSEVVQETIEINASKEYLTLSQCLDILNESDERLEEKDTQVEFLVDDSIATTQLSTAPTSQYNLEDDYYLANFENAIRAVYNEDSFSCLLNKFDSEVIKKFSKLSCKFGCIISKLLDSNL